MAALRVRRSSHWALPIAILASCWAAPGAAQQTAAKDAAAAQGADSAIDPAAMAAMDKVSVALQAMPSYRVTSDVTSEVVLVDGQKLQFGGTVQMAVHRPDAFKVVWNTGGKNREIYFDGRKFTIFAPKLGYYASFDAPPTIGQTLDKARDEFNIEVPLADLFAWRSDPTFRARVKGAMVIRPEQIDDRQCMHYAFRQDKVDWQIWVEEGTQALPCKLIITNRVDPAMPQYTAVLHWQPGGVASAADIAFNPPADAKRISMTTAAAMAAQKGDQQ